MVVDPATLTLGALHLFEPIFKAGKALYDGWELTKAFPSDMNRAAWRLKMHYLIFARKSELLVGDLCYPFDPGNEFNPATKTLLYSLNVVLGLFEECDKLILKYQPQGPRRKLHKSPPQSVAAPPSSQAISDQTSNRDTEEQLGGQANGRHGVPPNSTPTLQPRSVRREAKHRFKLWPFTRSATKPLDPKQGLSKDLGAPEGITEGLHDSQTESIPPTQERASSRIPNIPGLKEELEKEEDPSQEWAKVSLGRRISWAAGDKQALVEKIEEIGKALKLMEQYFKLQEPKDTSLLLPKSAAKVNLRFGQQQMVLMDVLHEALKKINTGGNAGGPFALSIKVREDLKDSLDEFEAASGKTLHNTSSIIFLQRHKDEQSQDTPTPLAVEVRPTSSPEGRLMKYLERAQETASSETANAGLEEWGYCVSKETQSTTVYASSIYHDPRDTWVSGPTLGDMVASEAYRKSVTAFQLYEIARLLALTYLFFTRVRAKLTNPRLDNVRYYQEKREDPAWSLDDPLLLKPWLSFGFGSPPPRRQPGAGSGTAKPPASSLAELGLLLYQVVGAATVTYGQGSTGFRTAKAEASKNMRKVTNVLGVPFVRIIKLCLEYEGPQDHLPDLKQTFKAEVQKLEEVITALRILGKGYEDVAIPAFSLASRPDSGDTVTQASEIESSPTITLKQSRSSEVWPAVQQEQPHGTVRSPLEHAPAAFKVA